MNLIPHDIEFDIGAVFRNSKFRQNKTTPVPLIVLFGL